MITNTAKQNEIHALSVKRFTRLEMKERDQRRLAVEDIKFAQAEDGQWDDGAKEKRKDRPRFTINRVAGAIDQLIGDQRQNRTNIKIRPVSGGASESVAETLTGLIRNIEADSKASNCYDVAFDEMVNGGYGGWRITTAFNDADFNQSIKFKPINTATTSLWFDDAAKEYDKRDAKFAYVTLDMPKEEHKERFPNSPVHDWSQENFNQSGCQAWFGEGFTRVAEYWVKTPIDKTIALLSDGRVIDSDEEKAVMDELAKSGATVVKTRKVKTHKVEMYLMDGSGILEGPMAWAGKYIPLIPVYGRQAFIENETYVRGIVRFAKDANRIYNYETSAMVETNALTPKDPYWYTPENSKGHEAKYRNFPTQNSPFMPYNPDVKTGGAPPTRTGAPSVQQGSLVILQQMSMDLYHVTGMQPPSIGVNPELKSGKAIIAQERQGDRGSFIFTDNLIKSIEYSAEILIDLIPRIYDTAQQVRILQQDGETKNVEINTINQEVTDEQTGKKVLVNDLSIGRYDIVTDTGPAFATQRQESAQQILDLIATSPQFEALAMDLVAKDLPILETKELTKRVRKLMIQNGTIKPTDEEIEEYGLNEPQAPDPQQAAITENVQMQTEKLMADIKEKDAKTIETLIDAQSEAVESYKTLLETYKLQSDLGIELTNADRAILIKQRDLVVEAQQLVDEGPNSEQATDIVNQAIAQEEQAGMQQQMQNITNQ
jgi:hypothetical protein